MARGIRARIGTAVDAVTGGVNRFDVLLLTAGIWFLAKFLRYAFPPLFDELQGVYDVSVTALGTAFTGFMLVYAAMQFPSGVLADRIGSVRVIVGGTLVAAIGALAVILGGPFGLLVAAMLVMGAGTGAHKTVAIQLLSRTYPARTGRALGVLDTLGTFGGVLAPLVVAVVVGARIAGVGWRLIFLGTGLVGIVFAVLFVVRVPEQGTDSGDSERGSLSIREYLQPFRAPRLGTFVVVTLGFSFAYNGIVAFLPLYLSREIGLSTAAASLLYSLFFVVSVVQLGSGELSDRIGRLPVIAGSLTIATLSLSLLVGWGEGMGGVSVFAIGAVAVTGVGIGSHSFRPVRGAHLTALLPEKVAGGGLGVVRTGLMGAGAVAPALVGAIADTTGSFRIAFGVLLAGLVAATLLALALFVTE